MHFPRDVFFFYLQKALCSFVDNWLNLQSQIIKKYFLIKLIDQCKKH
mgnify:CR=1 FL=1